MGSLRSGRTWMVLALMLTLLGLGGTRAWAERPRFTMEVSPVEVVQGERVTVTVTVERLGLSGADRYWPPHFEGLLVKDSQVRRSTASRIDPDKGQQLVTTERYRYLLEAPEQGRFEITPARIRVGVDEWETRSRWVRVRLARSTDAIAKGAELGFADAETLDAPGYRAPVIPKEAEHFLHAVVDRESVWMGQQLTVTWLLFVRKEVLKLSIVPPLMEGWWQETLYEVKGRLEYHDVRVDGRDFLVALIGKQALFPTRSGNLKVDPLTLRIETVDTGVGTPVSVASEALRVTAQPLPEPWPDGFVPELIDIDAVELAAERDYLPASEPLRIELRFSGHGALARLQPPRLDLKDFVVERSGEKEYEGAAQGNRWSASKTFEYWLRPAVGGELRIPPLRFPSFDSKSSSYSDRSTRPLDVTVVGRPEDIVEAGREELDEFTSSMALLRGTRDVDRQRGPSLMGRVWYWLLLVAPGLVYVGGLGIGRLRKRRSSGEQKVSVKETKRSAKKHRDLAELHLKGERPGKFYAELTELLYVYAEAHAGEGLRSLTRTELRERLHSEGLSGPLVSRLLDAMESFETARFAPSNATVSDMKQALERCSNLVRELERALQDEARKRESRAVEREETAS